MDIISNKLLSCPCGKTPKELYIQEGSTSKWAWVSGSSGSCCNEQFDRIKQLNGEFIKYKNALQKIASVNAMDYEYMSWAKEALGT